VRELYSLALFTCTESPPSEGKDVATTLVASGASAPPADATPTALHPRRPLQVAHPLGLVRGILADRVVVSTLLDPYMSLKVLAGYSGLAVRTLRNHLTDLAHPLPCYRVGGKILVRRSEFDAWIAQHRQVGPADVKAIVDDVLRSLGDAKNA
jgi:helix-turn-helix protein